MLVVIARWRHGFIQGVLGRIDQPQAHHSPPHNITTAMFLRNSRIHLRNKSYYRITLRTVYVVLRTSSNVAHTTEQSQICLDKAFRHTAVMIQIRRPLRHARQHRTSLTRDQPTSTRDQLDEGHLEGPVEDGVDDWVECTRHVAEPKAHLEDDGVNAARVAHTHCEVEGEEWRPTEDEYPEHHPENLHTARAEERQSHCSIRCLKYRLFNAHSLCRCACVAVWVCTCMCLSVGVLVYGCLCVCTCMWLSVCVIVCGCLGV